MTFLFYQYKIVGLNHNLCVENSKKQRLCLVNRVHSEILQGVPSKFKVLKTGN